MNKLTKFYEAFVITGVIFVILKLFKVFTLSWLWVLSPFWLFTIILTTIVIIAIIYSKITGNEVHL